LAAAHAVQEVAEVVSAAMERGDHLPVVIEGGASGVAVQDHMAVRSVVDVPDARAAVLVRLEAARLEDQLAVPIIQDGNVGVGRDSVILIAEAAAEADHALRES